MLSAPATTGNEPETRASQTISETWSLLVDASKARTTRYCCIILTRPSGVSRVIPSGMSMLCPQEPYESTDNCWLMAAKYLCRLLALEEHMSFTRYTAFGLVVSKATAGRFRLSMFQVSMCRMP